jgi:hypothetical protein
MPDRPVVASELEGATHPSPRRFAIWGIGTTLAAIAYVVIASLARTHGHLAYALDDGGIHLSLAWNLAKHATWGVVPHHFQSASSSPLWTLLLAACAVVLPRSMFEYAPVVLSSGAAVWLLVLLAREQTLFGRSRSRPTQLLEGMAIASLATCVLFIPGLAMTGMEHVLHAALVVQAVALFTAAARSSTTPSRWAYVALALGTATRLETLFVAAGIGVALIAARHARRAVLVAVVAGTPVVVIGAVSLAFGQQFFPNSVIAKSALGGGANDRSISLVHGVEAVAKDHVVLTLFLAALGYLIAARLGRVPGRSTLPATVVVVSVVLHSFMADYGWYERYQGYLIALGVFFVLGAAGEVISVRHARIFAIAVLAFTLAAAPTKYRLVWHTPIASEDTYLQRYQAGLFLAHFYDDQPVATGELGYVSYFHRGPITDFFGLGDHEVLVARERGRADAAYWDQLVHRRGVHVVAVYPLTLWNEKLTSWTLVGLWKLDIANVSGFEEQLQFWAPDKTDVEPLLRHLEEWDRRLPAGTHTEVNPFLGYASRLRKFKCC